MLMRAFLLVSMFFLFHWCLGAFALLRSHGWPKTVRWVLSAVLALSAAGVVQIVR